MTRWQAVRLACWAAAVMYTWRMATGRDHETPGDRIADELRRGDLLDGLDSTERKVLGWRIEQLQRAGFDALRANTLATTGDWRRAIMLVEEGCDHVVAADICL
jgi:hypothetical protein